MPVDTSIKEKLLGYAKSRDASRPKAKPADEVAGEKITGDTDPTGGGSNSYDYACRFCEIMGIDESKLDDVANFLSDYKVHVNTKDEPSDSEE
jgi:hypothetical protein